MDEDDYHDDLLHSIIGRIKKQTINPALLAEIKDAAAWDIAKAQFRQEGIEQGIEQQQILMIKRLSKQGFNQETIATMLDISIKKVKGVS